MTRFVISLLLSLQFTALFAVAATPRPKQIVQADGSTLTICMRGDEHIRYFTTSDGHLICRGRDQLYKYAEWMDGRVVPTDRTARNAEDRSDDDRHFLTQLAARNTKYASTGSVPMRASRLTRIASAYPRSGNPKALIILVNFQDCSFVTPNPNQAFTQLLNQDGYSANGGTGSARDYFEASSGGLFSPEFVVVGPYTLPNSMNFYGENDAGGFDLRPTNMIIDACRAADADVDFADFDEDGDGVIDNIFVYYAGHNEAEWAPEHTVWPHRWNIIVGDNYVGKSSDLYFDDKRVDYYACTSELRENTGTEMCGIGTFVHEFSHVLGLPDYYQTNGSSGGTIGDWSTMDHGNYNNEGRTPPVYSAYDRFFLGWLTPQELTRPENIEICALNQGNSSDHARQAYLIADESHNLDGGAPDPEEFFILEYRPKVGWDAYLPDNGMLIWHIDYDKGDWDNNGPNNYSGSTQSRFNHMRVYLQPLSGNTSHVGGAFKTGTFTPILWNKDTLKCDEVVKDLTEIVVNDEASMSFKFMGGEQYTYLYEVEGGIRVRCFDGSLIVEKTDTTEAVQVYDSTGRMVFHNDEIARLVHVPADCLTMYTFYVVRVGRHATKVMMTQ